MADSSQPVSQSEIEQLLKQAQSGSAREAASMPPSDAGLEGKNSASGASALGQTELDALLQSAADPSPTPSARTGNSSAKADEGLAAGDIDYLLHQAEQALSSINSPVSPATSTPATPFRFQDFAGAPASTEGATLDLLRDVELDVKIELGRSQLYLEDVLKLRKGSVVALDKLAGDPVDVYVNGRSIARGEVLVLNDNFCVRVAELVAVENAA